MRKKCMRTRSNITLPGWECQNIDRSFSKDEKECEKHSYKISFSQIKRVDKEETKMKIEEIKFDKEKALSEIEEMYRAQRRGRRVYGNKKKAIIVKRIKKNDNNSEKKTD